MDMADWRTFYILGDSEGDGRPKGCCSAGHSKSSNRIRTAKFTMWNFVFLNLFEQFLKLSNVYFLVISILQLLPVSSMTPTTWFPLTLVLLANMIKEGLEDSKRAKMDSEVNQQKLKYLSPEGRRAEMEWAQLEVGQVLLLEADDPLPADVVVLVTSDKQAGLCYTETANLDGETNLKNKESVELTHVALKDKLCPNTGEASEAGIDFLRQLRVDHEPPNENLNLFCGTISHPSWPHKVGITNKQIIYRGCTLRNTKWIVAVPVFTGMQTKLMMNATEKKVKRTTLDKATNKYIIGLFVMLGVICISAGLLGGYWVKVNTMDMFPFYLDLSETDWLGYGFLNIVTFLILLNGFIPISLTVTMEMVKVAHALFINWDWKMCYTDPFTGEVTHARARTSNLTEDLGRIQYIFSDKTGTLTQNIMEFMKCSINGKSYGTGTTEIGRAACLRNGIAPPEDVRPPGLMLELGNNFWDDRISNGAWRANPDFKAIEAFFTNLAVCHTVMAKPAEGDENDDSCWIPSNVVYQASSPDEQALVVGAKGSGFWFIRRSHKDVTIQIGDNPMKTYTVLNVCEFNSTRKRMSVIARSPDNKLLLMCKGADSVIYERLAKDSPYGSVTKQQLKDYANEGLRTLCIAQREISEAEYQEWNQNYIKAFTAAKNREDQLDAVAEKIEKDLTLLGATAIEDKLQIGVPDTIAKLSAADIQIWILTGDKLETAINIAMACNLINTEMHLIKVSLAEPVEVPRGITDYENIAKRSRDERIQKTMNQLQDALKTVKDSCGNTDFALIIDGYALEYALASEHTTDELGSLLQLTERCKAVVCCRVSPKQKADVVELVRHKKKVITLAIGDGGNDVSMIMKAHIGVGISGKEGVQAIMASDYSFAQFAYLKQLILVHGRWDFQRIAGLILFFFFKNVASALGSVHFGVVSGFSGINFWDDYYMSLWNVVFTSVPILFVAAGDKDMMYQSTLLRYPVIFGDVQCGQDFTAWKFITFTLEAIWCSSCCTWIPLIALSGTDPSGLDVGKWLTSFTAFASIHLVANMRLAMMTRTWTLPVAFFTILSSIFYWIFSAGFCEMPIPLSRSMRFMSSRYWPHLLSWATVVLTCTIALLPAWIRMCFQKVFFPTNSEMVAAIEADTRSRIKKETPHCSQVVPMSLSGIMEVAPTDNRSVTEEQMKAFYDEMDRNDDQELLQPESSPELTPREPNTNDTYIHISPRLDTARTRRGTVDSAQSYRSMRSAYSRSQSFLDEMAARPQAKYRSRRKSNYLPVLVSGHSEEEFMGYAFSQEAGATPEVPLCGAEDPNSRISKLISPRVSNSKTKDKRRRSSGAANIEAEDVETETP